MKRRPVWSFDYIGTQFTRHTADSKTRRAAKDKQALNLFASACVAEDLLVHDGGKKLAVKRKSLSDLAPAMGMKNPETASRKLSRVPADLISRRATFRSNEYGWGVGESAAKRYDAKFYRAPSAAELAANPKFSAHFPEDASRRYFAHVPTIVSHPDVPLTCTERLVLEYLFAHGLFVHDKASGIWKAGRVQQSQETIGAKLGLHRDTVRWALRSLAKEWTGADGVKHEGLGLLKFIGKPGGWFVNGKQVKARCAGAVWQQQEPNDYIGIAAFIESDQERYDRCMASLRATRQELAKVMDRIYCETMGDWIESNGQLKTFYAECRRRMQEAKISDSLIDQAIPRPPT